MKTENRFQNLASSNVDESKKSNNKAVIYTRVSTKEPAENNASLNTQKKYCNDFAVKKGLTIEPYFGGSYGPKFELF